MTRILALDLSLTNAGVCRLLTWMGGWPVFETETITVPPLRVPGARPGTRKNAPRTGADRLAWWRNWLSADLHRNDYCMAVMEAPAMHGSGRVFDIGELYGVVKILCYDRSLPLILVPPSSLKFYATGRGDSDKRRMIDTAVDTFGTQVWDEHQADAAWLCRMAAQADTADWPSPETEYEQKAIKALEVKGIL